MLQYLYYLAGVGVYCSPLASNAESNAPLTQPCVNTPFALHQARLRTKGPSTDALTEGGGAGARAVPGEPVPGVPQGGAAGVPVHLRPLPGATRSCLVGGICLAILMISTGQQTLVI